MKLGALRSFVLVFFNFDTLKSVIEVNNWDRSSFVAGMDDDIDGTCETLDVSTLAFGDRDVRGVDVCHESIVIECCRFSIKTKDHNKMIVTALIKLYKK